MATDVNMAYVGRVRDDTRRYIEELLRDNERLRTIADRVSREHGRLRGQLEQLHGDLERHRREGARTLELIGIADTETRQLEQRFVEVERQNSNLAALYAASYQLHATVRRTEVLLAIQEIVINLVGSEELAILGLGRGDELAPLASVGVAPAQLAALRSGEGMIGRALASGRPVVAGAEPATMTACIPLMVGARPLAVIAIFRLLPQKPALDPLDLELFNLLATHAANALYCAELHERHGDAGC